MYLSVVYYEICVSFFSFFFFSIQKNYLFFAHVYEFGVILTSDVSAACLFCRAVLCEIYFFLSEVA